MKSLTRTALILVGPVLDAHGFRDSALYDPKHEHVLRNRKNQASPGAIAQAVAESFGIDIALMRSRTRKRPVAIARQLAMLLIHELTDNTLHSIGVHFGRDYSTVTHSLEAARALILRDAEIGTRYRSVVGRFRP